MCMRLVIAQSSGRFRNILYEKAKKCSLKLDIQVADNSMVKMLFISSVSDYVSLCNKSIVVPFLGVILSF